MKKVWQLVSVFTLGIIVNGNNTVLAQPAEAAQSDSQQELDLLTNIQSRAETIAADFDRTVVSIACISLSANRSVDGFSSLRRMASLERSMFNVHPLDPEFIAAKYATGIVWDANGTIVTPYSSLGNPNDHQYVLWNSGFAAQGTLVGLQAEVIAGEPYTNLAALRVQDEKFAAYCRPITNVKFVRPKRGELCFRISCVGSENRDGKPSIEWGNVTNVQRSLRQARWSASDTSQPDGLDRRNIYSHGGTFEITHTSFADCSGAAIVNLAGDFIGLSIDPQQIDQGDSIGSFAIPADRTMVRAANSMVKGKLPEFGFIGIQPGNLDQQFQRRNIRGVAVNGVVAGMPAGVAGLRTGDIITTIEGHELENRDAIFRELAGFGPGSSVQLNVLRPRAGLMVLVDTQVKLTKRYVLSYLPAYELNSEPRWRGAIIDYLSAFPPDQLSDVLRVRDSLSPTEIAVIDVDLDTPAWQAGLRMGSRISTVNGSVVRDLEDFRQLTNDEKKAYRLEVQLPMGTFSTMNVEP